MHKLGEFHKSIYFIGKQIPKRDRFGIHLKLEETCLDSIKLAVIAALETKEGKHRHVNELRINVEVMKHLVRTMSELAIIQTKTYLALEAELQEISKMANGWLKYLERKEAW